MLYPNLQSWPQHEHFAPAGSRQHGAPLAQPDGRTLRRCGPSALREGGTPLGTPDPVPQAAPGVRMSYPSDGGLLSESTPLLLPAMPPVRPLQPTAAHAVSSLCSSILSTGTQHPNKSVWALVQWDRQCPPLQRFPFESPSVWGSSGVLFGMEGLDTFPWYEP